MVSVCAVAVAARKRNRAVAESIFMLNVGLTFAKLKVLKDLVVAYFTSIYMYPKFRIPALGKPSDIDFKNVFERGWGRNNLAGTFLIIHL